MARKFAVAASLALMAVFAGGGMRSWSQAQAPDITTMARGPAVPDWIYDQLDGMRSLREKGIRSEGRVPEERQLLPMEPSFNAIRPLDANAPHLRADDFQIGATGEIEVSGGVVLTFTDEDGLTIAISADRMTLE